MIETITIATIVVLFGILLLKAYNISTNRSLYGTVVSLLIFCLAIGAYGLLLIQYLGVIPLEETSTIIDGSSTITVTKTSNIYEYILPFTYVSNAIMFVIVILTFIESVMGLIPRERKRFSRTDHARN